MRLVLCALALAVPPALASGDDHHHAAHPDHVLGGRAKHYEPLIALKPGAMRLEVPFMAELRYEMVSPFDVDPEGTEFAPDPSLNPDLRAGLVFDTDMALAPIFLHVEGEYAYEGQVHGGDTGLDAVDPPLADHAHHHLRKGFGRLTAGPFLTLAGGYMVSDWGLGLIANGGDRHWQPGSAAFIDPRGGDRVLRTLVATGPWTSADLFVAFGHDWVQGDDIMLEGDEATQFVASAVLGFRKKRTIGVYAAIRSQEAEDGKKTDAVAFDLYGKWAKKVGSLRYSTEVEAALITGETELAPTADFPTHDILQLGVAARLNLDWGGVGAVLDYLFASGDRNFDDGTQNAFKADPNFEMGLLLFRHLMSATSARAPVRAANPENLGYPSEDLDRFPTRGSASNTHAFVPPAWYRALDGLEVYGGPLLAFTDVDAADPFESRLAGRPANAYGESGGGYLGTELDLGVRYRALAWGTELTIGAEYGVLFPGSAWDGTGKPDNLHGGRGILSYLF